MTPRMPSKLRTAASLVSRTQSECVNEVELQLAAERLRGLVSAASSYYGQCRASRETSPWTGNESIRKLSEEAGGSHLVSGIGIGVLE